MDPLVDPRCLVDPEAVVVDGADGVCRAPRLGAGHGLGPEAVLSFAMTLLALGWFVRARTAIAARRIALVATLVLAAAPGLWAVLGVRADRPSAVGITTTRITRLHDGIAAYVAEHPCAWIRTASCVACVPTAELARATATCPAVSTEWPIDLFADALSVGCGEVDGSLRCGTVDDDTEIEGGVPMRIDPFATDDAGTP